jgi:hypothetical protein
MGNHSQNGRQLGEFWVMQPNTMTLWFVNMGLKKLWDVFGHQYHNFHQLGVI